MRRGALCCWAVLFWGGGLALGQAPASPANNQNIPAEARPAEHADEDECRPEAPPQPTRVWARAEYLLWWIRDSHFPVLLTGGSATDPLPGALGMPGTVPLFGGDVNNHARSGGRFSLEYWLDDDHRTGAEVSYLFLGDHTVGTRAEAPLGAGSPVIARPFFNVLTGGEDSSLVVYPGLVGGNAVISSSSFLQGVEANATTRLGGGEHWRLDVLAGFRYLQLIEDLGITENVQVSSLSPDFAGNTIYVADQFNARNEFYGGQVGARFQFRRDGWDLEVLGKVGLGDSHQSVDIHGLTANTPVGQTVLPVPGGLLATASNSGHYSRDTFAVVPEAGVNLGYQINRYMRVFTGYTFVYWSDVARPGDQIDRGVNVNGVPTSLTFGTPAAGPARPAFAFHSTDFWAQGVNFGLEFRY